MEGLCRRRGTATAKINDLTKDLDSALKQKNFRECEAIEAKIAAQKAILSDLETDPETALIEARAKTSADIKFDETVGVVRQKVVIIRVEAKKFLDFNFLVFGFSEFFI